MSRTISPALKRFLGSGRGTVIVDVNGTLCHGEELSVHEEEGEEESPGVVVHVGQFEFLKINTGKREWRDAYHWILSLS